MLDISIKKLDFKKIDLSKSITITEKIDGIKINVAKIDNEFIISYKGDIIFENEYNLIEEEQDIDIFFDSKLVFFFALLKDKIKFLKENSSKIPNNTEFLFEYIVDKFSLMHNYNKLYDLICLGYSSIEKFNINYNRYNSKTSDFKTDLSVFDLEFKTIKPDFEGFLTDIESFELLVKHFANKESIFGNEREGIVIKNGDNYFKVQKETQHDKELRNLKKQEFINYNEYINKNMDFYIKEFSNNYCYNKSLEEIFYEFKKGNNCILEFVFNEKFHDILMYEILYVNLRKYIFKYLSNSGLVLGRFQGVTKKHIELIKFALRRNNFCTICIINKEKNERNPFSFEFIKTILGDIFKNDLNRIEIIQHSSANIGSILKKSKNNFIDIYCGEDRKDSYQQQIDKMKNEFFNIYLLKRNGCDISATALREAVKNNDFNEFLRYCDLEFSNHFYFYKEVLDNFNTNFKTL